MSTFALSDIATSLLIITQSKKGQCAGKSTRVDPEPLGRQSLT